MKRFNNPKRRTVTKYILFKFQKKAFNPIIFVKINEKFLFFRGKYYFPATLSPKSSVWQLW